jgi:NADH-quinone oxidoreductase subunit B
MAQGSAEVVVSNVRVDEESKILIAPLQFLMNWARGHSMWPLTFGTACCAIEMMTVGSARYDTA